MTPALARSLLPLSLAGALAAGCGARPVPLSAQAGSSVAIALAGEITAGDSAGYGGQVLASAGRYDDQRGELVFVLRDPASGSERALATRIVTRAWPDPASEAGLTNAVSPSTSGFGISQLLAIVDVPASTPAGSYDVLVKRRRRTDAGGVEELPAPAYGQRLAVLPASVGGIQGAPTPSSAWVGPYGTDVTAELAALVPLPKVVLTLPSTPPHAVHAVIRYPVAKMTPRAVLEEQHGGRSSAIAWSDDAASGRVSLDFVDPAASVKALALVFEPKAPLSAGRVALTEIGVDSAIFYDREGAVRTGTLTPTAIR